MGLAARLSLGSMSEGSARETFRLVTAGLTDRGQVRAQNEDHLLVRPELGLLVVADGMGGHNAGRLASILVTKSIANFFEATEIDADGWPPAERAGPRRLCEAVIRANQNVFEISSTHKEHEGMGSTVVGLYAPPGEAAIHIAHVGDSRCYRLRERAFEQMTRDHSLLNEVRSLRPSITETELARLPKNVVTRALGMKMTVEVDQRTEPLRDGDVYLLCSDGLTGMVETEEIERLLSEHPDPTDVCRRLVSEANKAGGTDNISALVVLVQAAPP